MLVKSYLFRYYVCIDNVETILWQYFRYGALPCCNASCQAYHLQLGAQVEGTHYHYIQKKVDKEWYLEAEVHNKEVKSVDQDNKSPGLLLVLCLESAPINSHESHAEREGRDVYRKEEPVYDFHFFCLLIKSWIELVYFNI